MWIPFDWRTAALQPLGLHRSVLCFYSRYLPPFSNSLTDCVVSVIDIKCCSCVVSPTPVPWRAAPSPACSLVDISFPIVLMKSALLCGAIKGHMGVRDAPLPMMQWLGMVAYSSISQSGCSSWSRMDPVGRDHILHSIHEVEHMLCILCDSMTQPAKFWAPVVP